MDTSIATAVTEILQRLPDDAAQRSMELQRLTDVCAAAEAAAALRSAAVQAREAIGRAGATADAALVAEILSAATVLSDAGPVRPDTAGRALEALAANIAHLTSATAAARGQIARAIASPSFLPVVRTWIGELRMIATTRPGTGACTIASALELWLWTLSHVQQTFESGRREAVIAELADALCALVSTRCQIVAVVEQRASGDPQFLTDLCHLQAARSAGSVATTCAELVFGFRRHPAWDAEGCAACYQASDLEALEGLMPGIASSARAHSDVIEADGSHPAKAGPCATFDRVESFTRLRMRLDGCLTGARFARDRAAEALPRLLNPVTTTR